ncbi:MAG: hypothetical protein HPY57_15220 [Ignavibacteria bacterium]|nr:hypothetical protein [Ignavibacteria bacterium]
MRNDWDEYLDDYEEYQNDLNWQVRLNDEIIGDYETKEDAIWAIMEEIDSETNNLFFEAIGLIGYNDEYELFNTLYNMCAVDFYEYLDLIYDNFNIEGCEYRLICLNNEEPEFGEL